MLERACETVRVSDLAASATMEGVLAGAYLRECLEFDRFWAPHLPLSRQRTRWLDMLKTLIVDLGSEARPTGGKQRDRRTPLL